MVHSVTDLKSPLAHRRSLFERAKGDSGQSAGRMAHMTCDVVLLDDPANRSHTSRVAT
jgi:hypothetical protein